MNSFGNMLPKDISDMDKFNALSVELNEIIKENNLNLEKSAALSTQIITHESRQDFIISSRAEAERIALEITSNASEKVADILARTQSEVDPLRKQIALIEMELAALSRNMPEKVTEESLLLSNESDCFLSGSSNNPKDQIEIIEQDDFNEMERGEEIFKEILKLRETLSVREREQDKPDISFKQKLGQIFKTRS